MAICFQLRALGLRRLWFRAPLLTALRLTTPVMENKGGEAGAVAEATGPERAPPPGFLFPSGRHTSCPRYLGLHFVLKAPRRLNKPRRGSS
ncbi:hypothetical protein EYF80_067382 [Liparis tanakae]|uniref:Uncharacterized protein n=1 Tax=Liparis tanakae TaxID=230148 RepID=A0A4Z2E1B1_9TELE|nr:hypothetical protein EYF80_067382 [Liparis tanakae]